MSISQLCTSVPLSTSCTDFTVNSKIFGEPRVLPPVLFMIEALNKAFLCRLFSVSCKQDAIDYEQNTPEYTYQRNETVFSLRIGQTFFFKGFRRTFKAKSYISTAQLTNIHSAVEMFTPRHLDTNDQILNTAHDA